MAPWQRQRVPVRYLPAISLKAPTPASHPRPGCANKRKSGAAMAAHSRRTLQVWRENRGAGAAGRGGSQIRFLFIYRGLKFA